MILDDVLAATAGSNTTVVVLSPHLDDAALSCGGLIRTLAQRVPVIVLNVFTDCGPPPHPIMGRRICAATGYPDPVELMAVRRQEDDTVLGELGARGELLGFVEAPFRRSGRRIGPSATYPTFRFDALTGRVSRWDAAVIEQVRERVAEALRRLGAAVVLAPLGVGGHVDHVIVRDVVAALAREGRAPSSPIYYTDYPYGQRAEPDRAFVQAHSLTPRTLVEGRAEAVAALQGYASQIHVLFPGGHVPVSHEQYWAGSAATVDQVGDTER